MANTYTQLYIHFIVVVKWRHQSIGYHIKSSVYKYIVGIIKKLDQKLICINGMPDHIHIMVSLKPTCTLSDFMMVIKSESSKYINRERLVKGKFEWQIGFGAFSVSPNQLDKVIQYIKNQEQHHQKIDFLNEYKKFLEEYNVDYKEIYIFKPLE